MELACSGNVYVIGVLFTKQKWEIGSLESSGVSDPGMERRRVMRKRDSIPVLLAVAAILSAMVACGGGGGTSESVNYTGVTMPAVIDTTSAVDVALNATLGAMDEYDSAPVPLGLDADVAGGFLQLASNPGKAFDFAERFRSVGSGADLLDVSAQPLAKYCDSGREDGISGYMTGEICIDTGNPDWLKLDITFVDYNDGVVYIDGRFIIVGTEYDHTIIFRDLVTESAVEDSYIDGWVDYTEDTLGQVVTITYNLAVIDAYNGEAFWLDDYVIVADYGNDEVTLSGNFYDFNDGYVTLTTETVLDWDLTMDEFDGLIWADHPTGGTVKLTGSQGYWISITFTTTGYYIQVNYTGDDDVADITLPSIDEYPWI